MHVGKMLVGRWLGKAGWAKVVVFPCADFVPTTFNDIGFATHPTLDFGPISNPDEGEPVLGSRAAPSFPFQPRRGFNLTAYAAANRCKLNKKTQ